MAEALDALYAQIPKVKGCKPGCHDCCGPVPLGHKEAARIASPIQLQEYGAIHLTPTRNCGTCAFSTDKGCSIYERRPFMCRLFGAADHPRMTCPHGAKADKPLSAKQCDTLATLYRALIEQEAARA